MASVLAPADCRACGGALLEARTVAVCDACLSELRADESALCARCGEQLPIDEVAGAAFSSASALCRQCIEEPPPFVRAMAFAPYDGTLRQLIRLQKFEGMPELARPLGTALAEVLRGVVRREPAATLHVVAVPLFQRRRRFNQSADTADAAVRELRGEAGAERLLIRHGALKRTRATESQSHLSMTQRRENVCGAFAVAEDVTGWTVVLVDDVYTTGSTAAECTRTLLRGGVKAVHVVTLARAQPERVARWSGT